MKTCSKCHLKLPLENFKLRKSGYRDSWCHRCTYRSRKRWAKAYRARKKHERTAAYAQWRRSNYEVYTLNILRKRARDKNISFNLTKEDLKMPIKCPVLGIPIYNATKKATDNSPSVDRVIPRRGYVKGNVCIISHRANMLKNNASLSELEAVIRYMKNFVRGYAPPIPNCPPVG